MADLREENAETRKVTETLLIPLSRDGTYDIRFDDGDSKWGCGLARRALAAMDTLSRWFARASRR